MSPTFTNNILTRCSPGKNYLKVICVQPRVQSGMKFQGGGDHFFFNFYIKHLFYNMPFQIKIEYTSSAP
jgi:hypothetical protein